MKNLENQILFYWNNHGKHDNYDWCYRDGVHMDSGYNYTYRKIDGLAKREGLKPKFVDEEPC